ncbi:hypothetical protein NDU88_004401 [Pleurodeles waltl]|uniref:Uncharacterized protein n=1 Tax=Pleurodeles waltl TaxID=8319 RepID=A0AAV7UGE6_PLEWA|nr:hypothetical protein NDU88_004401 [Pleurodeles waltl]
MSGTRACDWEALKVVLRGLCLRATYGVKRQLENDVSKHENTLSELEHCLPVQLLRVEEWQQTRRALLDDWRHVEKHHQQRRQAEGDKAGALFGRLIKQHYERMLITALVDAANGGFSDWAVAEEVRMKHVRKDEALLDDLVALAQMLHNLRTVPDSSSDTVGNSKND